MTDSADPDPQTTIPERIRLARRRAQLEQVDVAGTLGVSRSLISRWENGHGLPDVEQGARMAQLFEVSFGWLFGVKTESRWFRHQRHLRMVATIRDHSVTA